MSNQEPMQETARNLLMFKIYLLINLPIHKMIL